MKNGLLLTWMLAGMVLISHAQGDSSPNNRRLEKLKTELSLSDDQVAKFKEANEKFRTGQMRLRGDTSLTRAELMAERKKMFEAREQTIKKIFTKEQHAKWMAMKPQQGRQPGRSDQRENYMERMKRTLGLNDEQVDKIQVINEDISKRFKELRSDTTATKAANAKAFRSISEERNARMKEVLTEDQYVKFREMEARRMRMGRGARPAKRH